MWLCTYVWANSACISMFKYMCACSGTQMHVVQLHRYLYIRYAIWLYMCFVGICMHIPAVYTLGCMPRLSPLQVDSSLLIICSRAEAFLKEKKSLSNICNAQRDLYLTNYIGRRTKDTNKDVFLRKSPCRTLCCWTADRPDTLFLTKRVGASQLRSVSKSISAKWSLLGGKRKPLWNWWNKCALVKSLVLLETDPFLGWLDSHNHSLHLLDCFHISSLVWNCHALLTHFLWRIETML